MEEKNRPLIIVSYALKPGEGGAEAYVNKHFLLALYQQKSQNVFVIHGAKSNAPWMENCEGWQFFPNNRKFDSILSIVDRARFKLYGRGVWRIMNKLIYNQFGYGLKMLAWEMKATKILNHLLKKIDNPLVYSRVLPYQSLQAVGRVRDNYKFTWIANINDPLPPSIWMDTYAIDRNAINKWYKPCENYFSQLDGVTYPSAQLKELHEEHFPRLQHKPATILRHITLWNNEKGSEDEKFSLLYLGSLSERNQRSALVKSLKLVRENLRERIELKFVVPKELESTTQFAQKLSVKTKIVVIHDENEISKNLKDASAFLFMGFQGDAPLLYTKLCSYINSNKPIVGFASPSSTTAEILKGEKEAFLCGLNDSETFAKNLTKLVQGRKQNSFSCELLDEFHPDNITQSFIKFIDQLES